MDTCIVCKKRPALYPKLSEEQVRQFFCSKQCIFKHADRETDITIEACDRHNIWYFSWPKYDLYFICDECIVEEMGNDPDDDIAGYLPGEIGPTT